MIRTFLSSIAALFLLLIALVIFITGTHSGLLLLFKVLPGEFTYQQFSGTLLTHLEMKGFSYHSQELDLRIDEASITPHLLSLIKRRLNIEAFSANSIDLTIKSSSDEPIKLPWYQIALHNIDIKQLNVNYKQTYVFKNIKLDLDKTTANLNLNNLSFSINDYQINGQSKIELINKYRSNITLTIDSKSNSIKLLAGGNIDNWKVITKSQDKELLYLRGQGAPLHPQQLKWKANIDDLTQLIPGSAGSLKTNGKWNQSNFLDTNLNAKKLRWRNFAIKQLDGNAKTTNGVIDATLQSQNIDIPGHPLKSLSLKFNGTLQSHAITATLGLNNGITSNAELIAKYKNQQWQALIKKLTVSLPEFGNYTLQHQSTLKISSNEVTLDQLCLDNNSHGLCSSFHWSSNGNWQLQANTNELPLSSLEVWVPDRFAFTGMVNSKLNLMHQNKQLSGQLTTAFKPGIVHYHLNGEDHDIAYQTSTFNATLDKNGLTANTLLQLKNESAATAQFTLPNYQGNGLPSPNEKIKGNVNIHLKSLDSFELINPVIDKPSGQVDIEGSISGTIHQPTYDLEAKLTDGQVTIIPAGITIKDLSVLLQSKHSNTINLDISGMSDKQKLAITGVITPHDFTFPLKVNIKGEKVKVMDTPEFKIIASPDVNVSIDGFILKLDGKINIPNATFAPKDFSSVETLPSDTVYIDANEMIIQQHENPWKVTMDLNLTADKFKFNYKGLDAKIKGQLLLQDTPISPMTARGNLEIIDGSYNAYGQSLNIVPGGTLSFVGSASNPQLNLQAKKTISLDLTQSDVPTYEHSLIVGVQATGTLEEPVISLYSNVATLSQQDMLSYLVFGFASDQLNDSQSTMLWQALNAVGDGQSNGRNITQELQHTFGLDEVGFASTTEYNSESGETETGTSFVVGKNINDRLSVSYSVGILIPVNVLYLRYQLARHWALQSDSSTYGNGADIIYSISRD